MAKICLQCRYFYHGHGKKLSLCTNRHSEKFPDKLRHDGHTSVCKHFRPPKHKHTDLLHQRPPKHHHASSLLNQLRLKRIESFRGAYQGREIWILATGPGLDDIPKDFLEIDETIPPDDSGETVPKISIAVKEAAMVFPDCTYNIFPYRDRPLRRIYFPRGQIPPNFSKFIFSIRKRDAINFYGKQTTKATYIRYIQGGTVERMREMCDAIVAGNSSVYYGIGTIMHLAMASALVMGASKISLIGCEHGAVGDKLRAQSIKGGFGWQTPVDDYGEMKIGTNFLADYFRDHGVEIVRYCHGEGYELIGKAKEESESDEVIGENSDEK